MIETQRLDSQSNRSRRTAVIGTLIAFAGLALTTTAADARYGRNGAFVGGVAAGVLGGAIIANTFARPAYGYGYYAAPPPPMPACWRERRPVFNQFGDLVRYRMIEVCD